MIVPCQNILRRIFLFLLWPVCLLLLNHQALAIKFTVDNTADTDNGFAYSVGDHTNSLRKCIRLANTNAGLDEIEFNIPAAPYVITLSALLPDISDPVIINGYSQPGTGAGSLLIQLHGNGFVNALHLVAGSGGSTVRGLVIYGCNRAIFLDNSSNNTISGNYLGTNVTGTASAGSLVIWNGIELNNSSNNIIGGSGGEIDRNIISGSGQRGIGVWGGTNTGNLIIGNYIGVDKTGLVAIPNTNQGIYVDAGATFTNSQIGGASVDSMNIISGNGEEGIRIANSSNVVIRGNYIGVDATGNSELSNNRFGINIISCSSVTIGGSSVTSKNIISGNGWDGVNFELAVNCIVKANTIGLGANGTTQIPNASGVYARNNSTGLILGGATVAERNIISGNNAHGVVIDNSASAVIEGNYIGVNTSGNVDAGNNNFGVLITGSDNTRIGGTVAGSGNIISGNGWHGVLITGSEDCIVKANTIGLGMDGNTIIANGTGVSLENSSHRTQVGGQLVAERNIISGNSGNGLVITSSTNVIVENTFIGVDATGLVAKANATGININTSSNNTLIGGTTSASRVIVSGNNSSGIEINGSTGTAIKGVYIGCDVNGINDLGNSGHGIIVSNNSTNTSLGGSTADERVIVVNNLLNGIDVFNSENFSIKGSYVGVGLDGSAYGNGWSGISISTSLRPVIGGRNAGEGNVISSNSGDGVGMFIRSDYALVEGNYIGLDPTGLLDRGNGGTGLVLDSCRYATIGGTSVGCRNVVSANNSDGIGLRNDSWKAIIKANFCGINKDGAGMGLGNAQQGIYIHNLSDSCVIGGSTLAERNVCSGNGDFVLGSTGDGIRVVGSNDHTIMGNWCGTDSTGLIKIGNAWAGISINEGNKCVVGGIGIFERNICSGNLNEGVYFRNATNTLLINNYIGLAYDGSALGNEDFGINIREVSVDNIIGGSVAQANVIAHNKSVISPLAPGIFVEGASQRNTFTYNKINCNGGQGIDLIGLGNESVTAPAVTDNYDPNVVSGTGTNGQVIHLYYNTTTGADCDCEGEVYLGTATVAGGVWSVNHGAGLTLEEYRTLAATQTTSNGSTSEFSDCSALPVEFTLFDAALDGNQVLLTWKTELEINNHYFEIERSVDGVHFYSIGVVYPKENSIQAAMYNFTDNNLPEGILYYRLKQVDYDQSISLSPIKVVERTNSEVQLFTNDEGCILSTNFSEPTRLQFFLINATGQIVMKEGNLALSGKYQKEFKLSNLAKGFYVLEVYFNNEVKYFKIKH